MLLYICEKPSVARALVDYFNRHGGQFKKHNAGAKGGNGYYIDKSQGTVVTYCYGHLLKSFDPEDYKKEWKSWKRETLPIIPNEFKDKVGKEQADQYEIVMKLIQEATTIVNAGDPDREGQYLVDQLYENERVDLTGKRIQRILLNALDDDSITKALQAMESNMKYRGVYLAGWTRDKLDWLIGMNITRALTVKSNAGGYEATFNTGRCKAPTLKLVVDNYLARKNFKPSVFFTVVPSIMNGNKSIPLRLDPEERYDLEEKAVAMKEVLGAEPVAVVANVEKKEVKESVKALYSLDALQIEANRRFNMTPDKTLKALQSLYEKRYASYPRSDCKYLPTSQFKDAEQIIAGLNAGGLLALPIPMPTDQMPSVYNDSKITAHHAIVPTFSVPKLNELKDDERLIYQLIVEKFASLWFTPFTYNKEVITFTIGEHTARLTVKNVTDLGYKALLKAAKVEEPLEDKEEALTGEFSFSEGASYPVQLAIKDGETKPPAPLTSGGLVSALTNIKPEREDLKAVVKEINGLGTSATRSAIIEDLFKRGHITYDKNGKTIIPTKQGLELFKALPEEMTKADFTAEVELKLKKIEETVDEAVVAAVMQETVKFIKQVIQWVDGLSIVNTDYPCPACGNGYLHEKYYKKDGVKTYYYKCSNEACQFGYKNKLSFAQYKSQPVTVQCSKCLEGWMVQKQGKYGVFYGCSRYPTCTHNAKEDVILKEVKRGK